MNKRTKIIYILGLGHSGSTLLNILLGSSRNAFAVGELRNFYEYSKGVNLSDPNLNRIMKCDCGKSLLKCYYWFPVVRKTNIDNLVPLKSTFKSKLTTLKELFSLNLNKNKKSEESRLYYNILEQANLTKSGKVEFIIDSSKNLRNLMEISKNKNLDIYVIHLIRDGRGVVNSYNKMGNNWIRMYLEWLFGNILMFKVRKHLKNKYYVLSYDLFAQSPEKYIKKINKKFKLEIDEKKYIDKINSEKYHSIAGNQIIRNMKGNTFTRKKLTSIKYDQSWKKQMPKWKQYILTILCYIPNKLWVYNDKD